MTASRRPLALLACLLAVASATLAQAPAKPYRLFIGVDLKIKDGENRYRPVDSLKANEVILAEPDLPTVRLRDAGPFSWEHRTKVSRAPLTITDFEQHKVFSLRNDKAIQYMATQNNMAIYAQERADYQRMEAGEASRMVAHAAANRHGVDVAIANGVLVTQLTIDAADAWVADANAVYEEAFDAMIEQQEASSAMIGNTAMLDEALDATSEGGEDILALAFTLSSAEPIANAYVVVMGAVTQGEEKGVITFHQAIGAIGPEPRRIKIRQTGFQPGFTIEEVKLHVYAHGKELATNLSERAVPLSRDEAREFLLLSHIADHAVDSVEPTPVWTLVPPALLAAKSAQSFDYPVVANIDADGSVISLHETEADARAYLAQIHDAADLRSKATPGKSLASSVRIATDDHAMQLDQTGRIPAPVVTAMREMVFLPALDVGTPAPGTIRVNLADFFR